MFTILIIATTAIVSIISFNRRDIFNKLKFNAWLIYDKKQYFRFLSYALVHADWMHLLVNMFVLYSFGSIVESTFSALFGIKAKFFYLLLYIGGIAFSTLFDFGKNKDNPYYNAVGASGAVSSVLFASIIISPMSSIGFLFIPVDIPSPLFGLLYLIYSAYMAKRGTDNIGHSAHFWGAVFGIIFTIAIKPQLGLNFIYYFKSILPFL